MFQIVHSSVQGCLGLLFSQIPRYVDVIIINPCIGNPCLPSMSFVCSVIESRHTYDPAYHHSQDAALCCVCAGDALAMVLPMTVEAVVLYLAVIHCGCVVVSIADSFSPEEIALRLRISRAVAVFTQAGRSVSNSDLTDDCFLGQGLLVPQLSAWCRQSCTNCCWQEARLGPYMHICAQAQWMHNHA